MSRYQHVRLPVRSEILRGNPLGDPFERTLHLLVPDDGGAGAPYPVIWILQGYSGVPGSLFVEDPWSEGLQQRVERLSREGVLPPAIFAVPDCFTSLGGSQYVNSSATGRYEDYLWQELKPLVDERYPCGKHGIAGKSSGGFGALYQAMHHPEHVSAAACHSGDMAFELCYRGDFPMLAEALEKHGGVEGFLEAFARDRKKREGKWIGPLNVLCMAACYSPDPADPRGIALPFDPATLRLREEIWARWLGFDPLRLVDDEKIAGNLKRLDLLFLDCGTRDEYHLQWGLRELVEKLSAKGIAHEHQEFDDNHRSVSYRYDVSLPKLAKVLRGA